MKSGRLKQSLPCRRFSAALTTLALLAIAAPDRAASEPYLAIRTGHQCMTCHVNMTGGGKRTAFGAAYAHSTLSARPADEFWNGQVMEYLGIGSDLRSNAVAANIPGSPDRFEFDVDEAQLYVELPLLSDFFTVYLDQQVAPGTTSREIFALFTFRNRSAWIKAGKFFLPFGLRLEDDNELIRQVTGYNMNTPDNGIEAGITVGPIETVFSITNGTAGGPEDNTGKQYSFVGSYVRRMWRAGVSANYNDAGSDKRTVIGAFGGLRTGPVSWLGEIDYIDDESLMPGGRQQIVGFVEGNWLIRPGHNLKLSYGGFDPDDNVSNDDQNRYSLVYEYSPLTYLQIRVGARSRQGIPQNAAQNTDLAFVELHGYF